MHLIFDHLDQERLVRSTFQAIASTRNLLNKGTNVVLSKRSSKGVKSAAFPRKENESCFVQFDHFVDTPLVLMLRQELFMPSKMTL